MTHTDVREAAAGGSPATGSAGVGALLRRLLLVPTLTAIALALSVATFWLVSDSQDFHGHALGHWVIAVPTLFLALVFVRLPEATTAPRRMARLFVAIVLVMLPVSQLLEGIGAFGGALEPLHDVGEGGTLFSVFASPLTLVILVLVYLLGGIRLLRKSPSR